MMTKTLVRGHTEPLNCPSDSLGLVVHDSSRGREATKDERALFLVASSKRTQLPRKL